MAGIKGWSPPSPGLHPLLDEWGHAAVSSTNLEFQLEDFRAPVPLGADSCLLLGEITYSPRAEKWVLILLVQSKYILNESGG